MCKKYAIKPINSRYADIKIAKIPKGPAVIGVVKFNKMISKQKLTIVVIEINTFNIAI